MIYCTGIETSERSHPMNVIEAALLGLLQGLGEFLPISSSGHLELCQHLFGMSDNAASMMLLTVLIT